MDRRLMSERAAESIAAWNRHDADGVVAYAVEDLILRDIALEMPLHGREAVRAATREYLRAFPDLRVSVTSETVDGTRVVQEWTSEGTHRGELMGLLPTGRAVRVFGVAVITPDANMSATARSITTRRPLWVTEVPFDDGTHGFSCDGTPVDCVRLAKLGLVADFEPDLVVAGINHGSNLGDDITYSGTVAAALEGIVLGVPGIAVSQQSLA